MVVVVPLLASLEALASAPLVLVSGPPVGSPVLVLSLSLSLSPRLELASPLLPVPLELLALNSPGRPQAATSAAAVSDANDKRLRARIGGPQFSKQYSTATEKQPPISK
jgi:hypothetical protein